MIIIVLEAIVDLWVALDVGVARLGHCHLLTCHLLRLRLSISRWGLRLDLVDVRILILSALSCPHGLLPLFSHHLGLSQGTNGGLRDIDWCRCISLWRVAI